MERPFRSHNTSIRPLSFRSLFFQVLSISKHLRSFYHTRESITTTCTCFLPSQIAPPPARSLHYLEPSSQSASWVPALTP